MGTPDTRSSATGTNGDSTGNSESRLISRVRERATAQLSSQKDKATEGLGAVIQAVRQSTQQLRDDHHDTLAGYVENAADQVDRFSQLLREKDVRELVEDAQRFARRRPALFIGSAFALGVCGARFLRSSSPEQDAADSSGRPLPFGSRLHTTPTATAGEGLSATASTGASGAVGADGAKGAGRSRRGSPSRSENS